VISDEKFVFCHLIVILICDEDSGFCDENVNHSQEATWTNHSVPCGPKKRHVDPPRHWTRQLPRQLATSPATWTCHVRKTRQLPAWQAPFGNLTEQHVMRKPGYISDENSSSLNDIHSVTKQGISSQLLINDAHSMTNLFSSQVRHRRTLATILESSVTKGERH